MSSKATRSEARFQQAIDIGIANPVSSYPESSPATSYFVLIEKRNQDGG